MKFYILLENSKMTAEGQIFAIFTDTWPVAKTKELFTRTYRPSLCHLSTRSLSLWKFRMVEITFTFVNWMPPKLIFLYVKSDARFPKKIGGILTTIEWFVFVREAFKLDFARGFFNYIFLWNKRIFHRKKLCNYFNYMVCFKTLQY